MYIDKLDDIVNEYNNIYHRVVKMPSNKVKDKYIYIYILTLLKKLIIKILNLKLVIMLKYQNTKTFSLKDILQIGLKTIL